MKVLYWAARRTSPDIRTAFQLFQNAYMKGHLPAGRAQALMMISAVCGLLGRLSGLYLFAKIVVQVVITAIRDRNSQVLMQ